MRPERERFVLDKPWLKSLDEVEDFVRERIFEPEVPIEVVLIERGKPGRPLPGVDLARNMYITGDKPETLVEGFARKFREQLKLRRVVTRSQTATSS